MVKGIEILCNMLGINPEQLMQAAAQMQAVALSCEQRLTAMEAAIGRIERILSGASNEVPRPLWLDRNGHDRPG
jgi:hypothetical protein